MKMQTQNWFCNENLCERLYLHLLLGNILQFSFSCSVYSYACHKCKQYIAIAVFFIHLLFSNWESD